MVGLAVADRPVYRKVAGTSHAGVGLLPAKQAVAAGFANALIAGCFTILPTNSTAQVMTIERAQPAARRTWSSIVDHRESRSDTWEAGYSCLPMGPVYAGYDPTLEAVKASVSGRSSSKRGQYAIMSDDTATDLSVMAAVHQRLLDLSRVLKEDGDQLSLNSGRELLHFLKVSGVTIRPSIVGMETGTVRALWKTGLKEQVAIHFFGDGRANYVFFRMDAGKMHREFGTASVEEIKAAISERDLWRMLIA